MKWTAYNAFGGAAWLTGLLLAKNQSFVGDGTLWSTDHHVMTGLTLAAMGLVVLVWTNLRTSG